MYSYFFYLTFKKPNENITVQKKNETSGSQLQLMDHIHNQKYSQLLVVDVIHELSSYKQFQSMDSIHKTYPTCCALKKPVRTPHYPNGFH
jgi:hypothetical protein